ncbi:MAG: caspase family protein [Elusimicrobiota bacterium]
MRIWLAGLILALAAPAAAARSLILTGKGTTRVVTAVAFSPDGARILTASDGTLHLWDAKTGKQLHSWRGHAGMVRSVAFSPDGRKALSGGDDKVVKLWDLGAGGRGVEFRGHLSPVKSVAFSPDGKRFISGSADKTVRIWDVASGETRAVLSGHKWPVNAVAYSPDGQMAASASLDMSVRLWDASSGKQLANCLGHSADVLAVAFSPDGKTVLSGSGDKTLRLWDAKAGKQLAVWRGHRKWVTAAAFSPDGRLVASGSRDNSIRLWAADTGKTIATWKGHIGPVNAVAFSPDGETVVSGSDDETIKIWRVPAAAYAGGDIPKPTASATLAVKVSFHEPSGDDVLHGGSRGTIQVVIKNEGPGPAYALRVVPSHASLAGLSIPRSVDAGALRPGRSVTKAVPVEASEELPAGKVRVQIDVKEGNGFDAPPQAIEFETRAFAAPKLEVVDIALAGDVVKAGEITRVTVTVKNTGAGPAKGAAAKLVIESRDIFPSGDNSASLGDLASGEARKAKFQFLVNNRFQGGRLPLSAELSEARGRYGATVALDLEVGRAAPSINLVTVKGRESPSSTEPAVPESDVDVPPEASTPVDPDAYAVVIGIEKYRDVPKVEYAARDAQAVHAYLTKAMGYDPRNVALLRDERATRTDLEKYLGRWLKNRVTEKSRVFVYYAGHGAPNPATGKGYLIPYDGDPSYTESTAFPIKRLYATLAGLPTKDVTVVLDACFSGAGGRSVIAKGARPLVIQVDSEKSVGANTVVLAAARGSQISTFYPKARHGLLTYFILKGLRGAADAGGDKKISTEELFSYVGPNVEREARIQNVEQTPTMRAGAKARKDRVWLRLK